MHVLDARQFTRAWLENELFPRAQRLKSQPWGTWEKSMRGKTMATLFYAPSTRTHGFFRAAMMHLGGTVPFVIETTTAPDWPLEDVVQLVNAYGADVIVLRHDEEGIVKLAAEYSTAPVINAGDGSNQHPTQALYDIFTIMEELGGVDGISLALSGDLARGRTVHSLLYLLTKFSGVRVYLVSPSSMRLQPSIKDYAAAHGVEVSEHADLREVAGKVQVIYQTRIQKERALPEGISAVSGEDDSFCFVDPEVLKRLSSTGIIMHPLPRNEEIPVAVDSDPRAAYFRQVANGLFVRMALLALILGEASTL